MRIEGRQPRWPQQHSQVTNVADQRVLQPRGKWEFFEGFYGPATLLREPCQHTAAGDKREERQFFQYEPNCGLEINPRSAIRNPQSMERPVVQQQQHAWQRYNDRL